MTKFRVVCNQGDYAYKFPDRKVAEEAAKRHKQRTNHSPVFIYEVDETNSMTRDELLAISLADPSAGIINIERFV